MGANGTVLARFDSSFENKLRQWNLYTRDEKDQMLTVVKENISTTQQKNPTFDVATVERIYKVEDTGNPSTKVRSTMVWKLF